MKLSILKKQFFVLFLIAVFFSSCQKKRFETPQKAQLNTDVSINLAKSVALNFSNYLDFLQKNDGSPPTLKSSEKKNKKIKSIKIIYDKKNLPAIYIMNLDPTGFVIVSGTKKESPILAFSENNIFSLEKTKNNGLKQWIKIIKSKISYLRENATAETNDSITVQWDYLAPPIGDEETVPGPTVNEQVGPLLQTTWGQGARYNDLVPYLGCSNTSNGRALVGCVAVATAQVMRYWKYPYSTYNWDIMPNITYPWDSPTEGTNEIAKLMRDVGAALNMQYGCDNGSSAYTGDVPGVLVNVFGYPSVISYVSYNPNTVVDQLQYGSRPVIMRGTDGALYSGHAWVCDGYKRNRYVTIHNPGTYYEYETYTFTLPYFSMNWGWNGYSNGWYYYNDFTPSYLNFNSSTMCVINIRP